MHLLTIDRALVAYGQYQVELHRFILEPVEAFSHENKSNVHLIEKDIPFK